MLPLLLAPVGEANVIAGNLIVNIKETRIAVSKEMAQKIMV